MGDGNGFPGVAVIVPSIRKLSEVIGLSHTALNKHFAKGKFQAEPGGGYDIAKVRAALVRNADMSQPIQAKAKIGPPVQSRDSKNPEEFAPGGSPHDAFNRARAAKEIAIAREKRLDLRKREGELLEAEDVERVWTQAYTAFDNRMRLIPDKLAPRVAVLTDVLEIRLLIEKEIEAALEALSKTEDAA